ncbi:MAG: trehalose-6-phosphate synthase [Candidatus Eisenbacteria sp.]|nr:trehalose-6-phosphate synthase [Candidatus Eisenbacteria bacterium]
MASQDNRQSFKRLVVVSNRLPIVLTRNPEGDWEIEPGRGGLVTAMAPVLRNRGGLWIGWPGTPGELDLSEALDAASRDVGYRLRPVALTEDEIDGFYYGFSNEIVWPLFHDLQSRCNFDPGYWRTYCQVNRKFVETIAENTEPGDYLWIHDYHLMLVAPGLRELGFNQNIGFFLHIPFPPLDLFVKMPWRFQLLRAMLDYDMIGFQTSRDRRNFIQCIRALIKDVETEGRGRVLLIKAGGREIRAGVFPIGIDYKAYELTARSAEVADAAWHIHEGLPHRQIILGVDRLDYSKGIPLRLEAFGTALARYPDLKQNVSLVQVVVPSRENIPEYQLLRTEIEQTVSQINGEFTQAGWIPIHYIFRTLDRTELLAHYRTAEIGLVTPLKDGMNLVAKEYCACSLEENCVLILSEFAGAAAQLQRGAILVNPYDIEGVANAIYQAFRMTPAERRLRMRRLRQSIRKQDIFWWVDSFLHAAISTHLGSFPVLEDYQPQVMMRKHPQQPE